MNSNARLCVLIPLSALVICGECALAQTQQQDEERLRRDGVERADAAGRAESQSSSSLGRGPVALAVTSVTW